jgi:prefoldin subunit 5
MEQNRTINDLTSEFIYLQEQNAYLNSTLNRLNKDLTNREMAKQIILQFKDNSTPTITIPITPYIMLRLEIMSSELKYKSSNYYIDRDPDALLKILDNEISFLKNEITKVNTLIAQTTKRMNEIGAILDAYYKKPMQEKKKK